MLDAARSDIEDHVGRANLIDRDHPRRHVRRELLRHHHVDRQHDLALERLGLGQNIAGVGNQIVLAQRLADRLALGGEEGVGHAAADDQRLDLRQQMPEQVELGGNFCAANDRHHRMLRRLKCFLQRIDFRGGMDLRDEVMGTEGTIWINNFLRTGFEMFTTGKGADYVAEKAESNSGWLFPVGDEINDLGYNHMFTDMFSSIEKGTQPTETFYDGYVVNAIIDAAYKSAKTKLWEPVQLEVWRGQEGLSKPSNLTDYDADYYLVKEEVTHYGAKKLILKNKKTGKFEERILE